MTSVEAKLRWRTWWLLIGSLMLVAILILALVPLPQMVSAELPSDKLIHLLVFAFLMVWFAALYPQKRAWLLFLALMGYGVLMEGLQSQVPNRYAELADLVADGVGLAAGWVALRTPLRRWPQWLEHRLGIR